MWPMQKRNDLFYSVHVERLCTPYFKDLQKHCGTSPNSLQPKTIRIVQRLIAHLKQLMKYCDFHHSLEAMLHDRFMCGINDTRIQ